MGTKGNRVVEKGEHLIKTITITPHLVKAGDEIKVTAKGQPGSRVRFSIANVFSATDLKMTEDPSSPGSYSGGYTAEVGDNVKNANVLVLLTTKEGKTVIREAKKRLTIDTIPPQLFEPKLTLEKIRNSQILGIAVKCKAGCTIVADISKLDTTKKTVLLKAHPGEPNIYTKRIRLSRNNKADNGIKTINIKGTDAAENESSPVAIQVSLENSELGQIRGLDGDIANRLNKAGVITLSDLRHKDLTRFARRTGLSGKDLECHQAAAKFQAIGLDADVVHTLVYVGNFRSLGQVAMASKEEIEGVLRIGIGRGILPAEEVDDDLAGKIITVVMEIILAMVDACAEDAKLKENTCQDKCADQLSAFGCHAYLLYLAKKTGKDWDELSTLFLQNFLEASNLSTRRIDIAISVLEQAISERRLDFTPRRPNDWQVYDEALNNAFVKILSEIFEKSESNLVKEFPDEFNRRRRIWNRNRDLEDLIVNLPSQPKYYEALVKNLIKRTGKTTAALEQNYPNVFNNALNYLTRIIELERILDLDSPDKKLNCTLRMLASLKLEALIKQSGNTPSDLRNQYYISFSLEDCGETTTCRQAILTLQEYMADKEIMYLFYDEWRLEQEKKLYPENFYTHEFAKSLINGNRHILHQHLNKALEILDSVRISENMKPYQKDDLLKSYRWKFPYYENLKIGLDLIQECWNVDDLMVKGHESFISEEYLQAQISYLEAAEKIRQISKKISMNKGCDLLPLWSPDGKDSFFTKSTRLIWQASHDYLQAIVASFSSGKMTSSGITSGQISLSGISPQEGTFIDMYKQGLTKQEWAGHMSTFKWKTLVGNWKVSQNGALSPYHHYSSQWDEGSLMGDNWLFYEPGGEFTDLRILIEIGHMPMHSSQSFGVAFRFPPGGLVENEPFGCITISDTTKKINILQYDAEGINNPFVPYIFTSVGTEHKADSFVPGEGKYEIDILIQGKEVTVTFNRIVNNVREPDGELSHTFTNLKDNGSFALFSRSSLQGDPIPFNSIMVWNLAPVDEAASDSAFFLPPIPNIESRYPVGYFYGVYEGRQWESPETLADSISINYEENNWIIDPYDSAKDKFDPLGPKPYQAPYGLFYGKGDDHLNRENLRRLLDGFLMLFCHQYFFMLPILLGDVANAMGRFEDAAKWYHLVFDERRPWAGRKSYRYFNDLVEIEMMHIRIAGNYIDWANFLYNQNTQESIQKARRKYRMALKILETENCCKKDESLLTALGEMLLDDSSSLLKRGFISQTFRTIFDHIQKDGSEEFISHLIKNVHEKLKTNESVEVKEAQIQDLIIEVSSSIKEMPTLSTIVERRDTLPQRLSKMEELHPHILDEIEAAIRTSKDLTNRLPAKGDQVSAKTDLVSISSPMTLPTPEIRAIEVERLPMPVPGAGSMYNILHGEDAIEVLRNYYLRTHPFPGTMVLLPGRLSDTQRGLPAWVENDFCIPRNPVIDSLTRRACQGIYFIDHCLNALGFPQNDLSVYRFAYLLSMAKNFTQMALAAEKDFIQFKDQFEKNDFELMNATQAVSISRALVQLSQLKINEALNQVDTAKLGIENINAQIAEIDRRIGELGSEWSIFGIIFGAIAAGATAYLTAGSSLAAFAAAAVGTAATGTANHMAGIEDNKEALEMQRRLLETVEKNAARQNLKNAIDALTSAFQQARISEIETKYAAEKAQILAIEFFNPQLWSFLAREIKKHYRTYLTYGTIAAWLAQRALQFERGIEPKRLFAASGPDESGSGLSIIRFDYFQPSQQGLLGADNLLRDIATLENEKILHKQRKKRVPKVISMATTRPLLFGQFLETGVLPFATTMEEFDWDYAGHYQRRIRTVRINLFGLVGPEGIKATLTCLGSSQVVVKEFVEEEGQIKPVFVEKTLRRTPESVALTNPIGGGIGQIPLVPKEEMLNPFEGNGVAAQWIFEMPKHANQIDFNTITDIQILVDYTALDDPLYRNEVLNRLPRIRTAIRPYSFCAELSDACFHLKDGTRPMGMIETSDETTGAQALMLTTQETDFTPNQNERRLKEVVVYFRSKAEVDYSKLKLFLTCGQCMKSTNLELSDLTIAAFTPAEVPPQGFDTKKHYMGKWRVEQLMQDGSGLKITDTWYLHIPWDQNEDFLKKDENDQDLIVNGHKVFDFSGVQDVIFALHYDYRVEITTV